MAVEQRQDGGFLKHLEIEENQTNDSGNRRTDFGGEGGIPPEGGIPGRQSPAGGLAFVFHGREEKPDPEGRDRGDLVRSDSGIP